jgi:hypothetical protein
VPCPQPHPLVDHSHLPPESTTLLSYTRSIPLIISENDFATPRPHSYSSCTFSSTLTLISQVRTRSEIFLSPSLSLSFTYSQSRGEGLRRGLRSPCSDHATPTCTSQSREGLFSSVASHLLQTSIGTAERLTAAHCTSAAAFAAFLIGRPLLDWLRTDRCTSEHD